MQWAEIYCQETDKSVVQFVTDMKRAGAIRGFVIHNESSMEMAHTFGAHGVQVGEQFDLHMIQVCKPEKAAASLQSNPERAALMPKFIIVFTDEAKTQVRLLVYNRPMIEALTGDAGFADSLAESYDAIRNMIMAAL